jgi:hypothetical protein
VIAATRALVLVLTWTAVAVACPLCESETGRLVRAGIAAEFGWRFLAIFAPVPILVLVVALLHFGWPGSRAPR